MIAKEKEFVSVYASESLADNYARILKDTSEATQISYHKRYLGWRVNSVKEFSDFIETLDEKWLNGEYRYATVRQYKAAIGYALSSAHQFKIDPKELKHKFREYYQLSQSASIEDLELLYQRNMWIGKTGDTPTLDKKALANEQTSTTKDKRFPAALLTRILEYDPARFGFLQDFLTLNTKLGLRPIEYQNATLLRHDIAHNEKLLEALGFTNLSTNNALNLTASSTDKQKPLLLVKNAKHSHSRACGEYRLLYLDVLSNNELTKLRKMMVKMRHISENSDKAFGQAVIKPLSTQLYRILTADKTCKSIVKSLHDEKMRSYRKQVKKGFRNPPVFKRPTLYSTRHQAVATAKAADLHPVLIAACFGHSSVFTAENHYGKSIFGKGGLSITPSQVSINEVIVRLTEAAITPREAMDLNKPTKAAQAQAQAQVEAANKAEAALKDDVKSSPTPTYTPRF